MIVGGQMWIGTIYGGEMVNCPQRGADISPIGVGGAGTLADGGGYVSGPLDSHREFNFSWSDTEAQADIDKIQKLRDGWHSRDSRDLIFFIDPFAARSNILPKRWAQPSIMLDDNVLGYTDTLMGRLRTSPNRAAFPTSPNVPQRIPRVEAPLTNPERIGGRTLFIPAIPQDSIKVRFLAKPVAGVAGSGLFARTVNANGVFGSELAATSITIPKRPATITGSTIVGYIFYLKGQVDFAGGVAQVSSVMTSNPSTDAQVAALMRPGMGHSGCRFNGNPTIIGTSAVLGVDAYLGYATTLVEVGDWYQ